MWIKWKRFEKMTEDQNFTYLGTQNDPTTKPPRPLFYTHLKVAPISLESEFNINQVQTFLRR